MTFEADILAFVEQLCRLYIEHRDIDALLGLMDESVSWMGLYEHTPGHSLLEARHSLLAEQSSKADLLKILHTQFFSAPLSEGLCVVNGDLRVTAQSSSAAEARLQASLIFRRNPDGIALCYGAFSAVDCVASQLEDRSEDLLRHIPGGVYQCLNDVGLTLQSMSDTFLDMFGYTRQEIRTLFGDRYINMVHPDDRADLREGLACQLQQSGDVEVEYRVLGKGGRSIWVFDKSRLFDSGAGSGFYGIIVEITDRKRQHEKLRLSLERHKVIMNQTTDIIFEWDIVADTLHFSDNWAKKFRYEPIREQISTQVPLSSNIHPDEMSSFLGLMHDIRVGVPYVESELRIRHLSRQYHWCRIRATAQFDDEGRPIKAIGVIIDVTAEKQEKLHLLEMARRDALTGLYNKSAIRAQVEQRIRMGNASLPHALLIIDVDRFKFINDNYGHLCGDALLLEVAEALRSHFRSTDLIGRIGGDEFLVYLPEVANEAAAHSKIQSLLCKLREIRPFKEAALFSCSIGVALTLPKESDYLSLYRQADRALYHQKHTGKDGISFYHNDFSEEFPHSGEAAYSAVNTSIDSSLTSGVADESLAQHTLHMLYQSMDAPSAINELLEVVGRAYDVSRVYIFENSQDTTHCSNTFEWCAAGTASQSEHLQNLSYEMNLADYPKNFGEDGVFYCRDTSLLDGALYRLLASQGIRSLLQCAIFDAGRFKGFIGLDECRENRYWTKQQVATLTLISNVLAVFLTKFRLEEQLERLRLEHPASLPKQ